MLRIKIICTMNQKVRVRISYFYSILSERFWFRDRGDNEKAQPRRGPLADR